MGFTRSKSIAILTPKDKKQVKTLLGVAKGHKQGGANNIFAFLNLIVSLGDVKQR